MARRVAVLMKLKDGVSKAEVKTLCDLLRKIGDPEWLTVSAQLARWNPALKAGPKADEAIVTTYDDEHGDPTFYIP